MSIRPQAENESQSILRTIQLEKERESMMSHESTITRFLMDKII